MQSNCQQLPSPISPSTELSPSQTSPDSSSQQTSSFVYDLAGIKASRSNLLPMKGFLHEVLHHSQTSGGVLQTAPFYLEAIRLKEQASKRQHCTEDTPSAHHRKGVNFTPQLHVHRYPPAVWDEEEIEEEDVEWDDAEYSDEDSQLAEDLAADGKLPDAYSRARQQQEEQGGPGPMDMEPDDGMQWDKSAAEANQQAQIQALQAQQQQQQQQAQQEEMARRQQQQQQEDMEQREQLARQQQQQAAISQQRAQQQEQQQQQQLRTATSRERLNATPDRDPAARSQSPFDPLQVTETRKLTVTPPIARDDEERKRVRDEEMVATAAAEEAARKKAKGPGSAPASVSGGKGQMGPPVSSASIINVRPAGQPGGLAASGAKLRKERDGTSSISSVASTSEDEGGGKKKKSSFIGGLFSRNKSKKNPGTTGSIGSLESAEAVMNMRPSDDGNGRLSSAGSANGHGGGPDPGLLSPTTQTAMSQQQASIIARSGTSLSMDQQRPSQDQSGSAGRGTPEVSQHASQLRQHDQQQQALYLNKYLNRSPASPPNAGAIGPGGEDLSWGLQTAQAVAASRERGYGSHMAASSPSKTPGISTTTSSSSNMLDVPSPISIAPSASYNSFNGNSGGKPRPGSLVISPGAPDLSVIRVFAGQNLQTEATFKTVLLNSSTTSSDLIRQAIQRFRLLGASAVVDHADEYYLTAVKQVEGSSAVLRPDERPLYVFESLVEEARMEMEVPKVKRSSVGSISSVSSNLSMHPAIKKLPMNDFTDDSAVKFYLNRRGEEGGEGHVDREDIIAGMESARHASEDGDEVDVTLIADSSMVTSEGGELSPRSQQQSFLGVGSERFSSPSFRFSMQLVIYAEDLPDDMVFDPLTEAIVFKHTLRDRERGGSTSLTSSTSGPTGGFRRKVFVFPKNVTVAEVIELGLERFGIQEGVVDGGDEVEDKMNKRKSGGSRVRYGLFVKVTPASEDRELLPASRLIEAFPRLPTFRRTDTSSNKRRSTDSAMLLLGSMDDVASDDPTFILRRAISYRNSTSRHRTSASLDEIAMSKLHRFSQSSSASASFSERSEMTASPTRDDGISSLNRTAFAKIKVMQQQAPAAGQQQSQQKSRQEIKPLNVQLRERISSLFYLNR